LVSEAFETLRQYWPEFEPRPPQEQMAESVFNAFLAGGRVAIEAPTGVGKSIAYLIPSLLAARDLEHRVVISTYTKNLQQQIVARDAPRIRDVIAPELKISLIKGRSNYVCHRKWNRVTQEEILPGARPEFIERVRDWVSETESGDLEEFGARNAREWAWLRELAAPVDVDPAVLCHQAPHCFVRDSRRRAATSPILVVNHALLLTHHLTAASVLPDYDILVVDEAHALADAAAHALDRTVSSGRLRSVLARLTGGPELTLLGGVHRLLASRARGSESRESGPVGRVTEDIAVVRRIAEAYFRELALALGDRDRRYRRHDAEAGLLGEAVDSLIAALATLVERLKPLVSRLGDGVGEEDERDAEIILTFQAAAGGVSEFLETLRFVVEVPDESFVYWYQPSPEPALVARPLHPGDALRDNLFGPLHSTLLCSATLSIGEDFRHFLDRVGIPPDEVETQVVGTPFELERQVLALAPPMPSPNDPRYAERIAGTVAALARAVGKKMMVLFTSFSMLEAVHTMLSDALEDDPCVVLGQSVDGQRETITRAFRRAERAVLLGTASFWGGVDFPGDELELLVVARLPFPVPSEPIVAARCEEIEADGESSFQRFMIPEAVLRFKQGFGRLIRRGSDRGVFAILDPRIRTASYRRRFHDALPVPVVETKSVDDAVARAAGWFRDDQVDE